jgi:hypothetical protein
VVPDVEGITEIEFFEGLKQMAIQLYFLPNLNCPASGEMS